MGNILFILVFMAIIFTLSNDKVGLKLYGFYKRAEFFVKSKIK